ncbi:hypothetical protein CDAR_463821 [Caerostris darwini]|uniref:Uncharacterized protein n=1 Tax=Caerostris darwini TaxID=1538125 RepID=A0AAV4RYJ1_9ARAC|nr:hypothetical protein CDAR_463821 [Caerostris darwini]
MQSIWLSRSKFPYAVHQASLVQNFSVMFTRTTVIQNSSILSTRSPWFGISLCRLPGPTNSEFPHTTPSDTLIRNFYKLSLHHGKAL